MSAKEQDLLARIAVLEAERDQLVAERDRLKKAHRAALEELELLRRRIFAAKAERVDTAQLELEFAQKLASLGALEGQLGGAGDDDSSTKERSKSRPKPKGRRDLASLPLPIERIEITDPVMESLVLAGQATRIGFEESSRLGWRRASHVRVELARVKYTLPTGTDTSVATAPLPAEILSRSIATPSLLASIATDKFEDGLPLFRQEARFERVGVTLDRGTMSRWLEEVGNLLGATVVEAARLEAMRTAFCIATDATGVLVQPIRTHEKQRQACRRGHFFVQVADRDHVFFEYTARETSGAVLEMFRGFGGYIQADASSVFDILYRDGPDTDGEPARQEVGCWSHCRRYFYDAAVAKDPLAREGLYRIHRIFENETKWTREGAARKKELRHQFTRPHVEAFLLWAETEYERLKGERGLLRSAFGYATRQKEALRRFLNDGRLGLDNNRSERALRRVAVGRKNWLFIGSDDHGQAVAAFFSLIASARLFDLDPETYLRDLFRVLPHWPKDRYLELAPKYWSSTRERLDPAELGREVGTLIVPSPTEQPPSS